MLKKFNPKRKSKFNQAKRSWLKPDSKLREAQMEWQKMEWQLAREEREKNATLQNNQSSQGKSAGDNRQN